jgi:hypothetical protein
MLTVYVARLEDLGKEARFKIFLLAVGNVQEELEIQACWTIHGPQTSIS